MEEGKAYALLINNFSETENGFTIEFGGTGEFLGPQPDVELIIDKSTNIICVGEEVGFSGQASSFQLGQITDYQWSFGAGASPSEATGVGPHTVLYNTPGEKTVVLTLTTNLGCIISDVKESIVMVEPCCETINGITGDGEVTNVICGTSKGAVDLTVTSASPIFSYQWSNNQTTEDIDDLGPDEYAVTVTNFATCTEVFTFPVDSVAPFLVETDIT
jgi:PKD repeat protein